MKKKRVCMYGAASDQIDRVFLRQGEQLGREIAEAGYTLVYGGGSGGMMGACSRGVLEGGGKLIGVVPAFMDAYEGINENCTELIWTDSMGDRKTLMENLADAFIVTPGGIGTMDEFFQILTLGYLDRKAVPIIIFNIKGFFDPILEFIDQGVEKGFIHEKVRTLYTVRTSPKGVISAIRESLQGDQPK